MLPDEKFARQVRDDNKRLVYTKRDTKMVWFKNRRAKWRKRERNAMNAAAAAAADFKSGFGVANAQFNGLMTAAQFADTEALYSPYASYAGVNNWAAKVPPSPWGRKVFGSVVPTNHHHHHQSAVNCFNPVSSSISPAGAGGVMGVTGGVTGGVGNSAPCPYTTPTNPYVYRQFN
ncbi:pituitary homeobox homolog Ptx1-like [Ctenocephalides felis]|uniref:pituitary homeobox homolog Ptx1-like n=1 Tax=Ctenocephalides felis TaxID=7515 RepID=UPI000E6E2993|nr:pituitary homeobox homolog Ptx1-like [Ctenocephalides felis]